MRIFIVFTALVVSIVRGFGAPFQNLNFEQINTSKIVFELASSHGMGRTADLLPGWQVFSNGVPVDSVLFNTFTLGTSGSSFVSIEPPKNFGFSDSYFVRFSPGPDQTKYTLRQTGDVPADALFLSFNRGAVGIGVTMNGTLLPFAFEVINRATVTDFFDLAQFAGKTVELDFTPFTGAALDNIAFVPEPSVAILCVFGLTALFVFRPIGRRKAG